LQYCNGKTIPYPGLEPGISGLAVGSHNPLHHWVGWDGEGGEGERVKTQKPRQQRKNEQAKKCSQHKKHKKKIKGRVISRKLRFRQTSNAFLLRFVVFDSFGMPSRFPVAHEIFGGHNVMNEIMDDMKK
jgi:hypothetical protein